MYHNLVKNDSHSNAKAHAGKDKDTMQSFVDFLTRFPLQATKMVANSYNSPIKLLFYTVV